MCTVVSRPAITPADLAALAIEHRIQAERSTNPVEQLELHRVADIYTVLATIDIPIETLARATSCSRRVKHRPGNA